MSALQDVIMARLELDRVEAEAEERRRSEASAELKQLQEKGHELEQRYAYLHGVIVRGDSEIQRLRNIDLKVAWAEYETWSAPLPVTAFVTDADREERARQAERYKVKHSRVLEKITERENESGEARNEALLIHNSLPKMRSRMEQLAGIVDRKTDTGLHFVRDKFL